MSSITTPGARAGAWDLSSPAGGRNARAVLRAGLGVLLGCDSVGGVTEPSCPQRPLAVSAVTAEEPNGSNIFTMCADGSGLVQLTTRTSSNNRPAWSPDGSRLVFESLRTGDFDIWTMRDDGSELRNLTSTTLPDPPSDVHGAWSPDGARIAFSSDRSGEGDIYLVDADGSDLRRLTTDSLPELHPSWSPDGERIVFQRNDVGGSDLWVVDVLTGVATPLTDRPGRAEDPRWSPDGTRILFVRSEPLTDRAGLAPPDLWAIAPDGTGLRNLTSESSSHDYDPSWHPDGERIAFVSNRSANADIYLLDSVSGVVVEIANRGGVRATGPAWRR